MSSKTVLDLSGTVTLIAGTSRGIGRDTAVRMAEAAEPGAAARNLLRIR